MMACPETLVGWHAVEDACRSAKAIAFDGCHKIYLAMDDDQVIRFEQLGYGKDDDGSQLIAALPPQIALGTIKHWYETSCFLKFVEAVSTDEENPNRGFIDLIPQGYDPDTEEWL